MEQLGKLLNWDKENPWAWLLKCLLLIASTLFICLYRELTVLIFFTLVAWKLIRPIIKKQSADAIKVQDTEMKKQRAYVIREIMFWLLNSGLGKLLEIQKPEIVDDITPLSYPVFENIEGLDVYRFSVFYGFDKDTGDLCTLARNYVARRIQEGNIPELPIFMYKDVPTLYVLNVRLDPYEAGYMMILVTYVDNDCIYAHIKDFEQRQAERKAPGTRLPNDVEF